MKKMNKYLFMLFGALITLICGVQNVSASTLTYDFSGYWYERSDNGNNYSSWRQENYYVDGNVAYCIEPGIPEGTNQYRVTDWSQTGLSTAIKDKVTLYAYYGYQYDGHQTIKYRMATQGLIWESILGGNTKVTFNTERYGAGSYVDISAERNEIKNLVAHHYDKPSMNGKSYTAQVGTPITIEDTNGVLSKFEVKASNGAEVSIDGNKLTITPTEIGTFNLTFVKKQKYSRTYLVYYADGYQNMISGGNVDPVTFSVKLTGLGGKVKLQKVDSKTKTIQAPKGSTATVEGAVYGIYDESDNLIQKITTDKDGIAVSDYLPFFGRYYLKELEASKGYQLSNEKIPFDSSKDELLTYVKGLEDVIERKYEFAKVYASDKTQIMTPEVNVEFGLYDSKNNLVEKQITDKEGKLYFTIPYGSYTLKQLTSTKDYEYIEDYKFEVKEIGATINMVLSNAEITAKLKVIKIDADSGKVIPRKDITFKIFDVDNNEYVCQTITYPTAQKVCEFKTDSNGVLITPYALKSGTYKLEEVDQAIDGYLWNKESVEFHIGENAELITDNEYGILFETKFKNKQVKGQVEINKLGEELVIEDNSYHYEEIKLDGVTYDLYANEDIISADGTKIYNKGDLIGTYEVKDGYLKIDRLYLGKYFLLEKSTLDSHVLDTTKHYFTLKYKDQYTPIVSLSFTFKNYLKKGTLEFTKTDIVTGTPLPNTKIQIFDEELDQLIFEGTTDESGKIIITDLYVSKFYLVESEAPEGYTLNPEKMHFEIKENGEIVKADMTDEQIVEVPNTSLSDSKVLDIISLVFIVAGVGYIIYENKKKK